MDIELPEKPIVAGTSVGYLPGSPEVSPTGEMTYTLPLDVPPGVAGMEPHLALTYSSRAGSGPIGRGWSLAGGSSSITRCPKSLAVNGTRDGVDFDGTDGFCLDGQQLVSVGPGEYRTENDTIARILMDGFPAAPTSFTVFLKNGRNRTYEAVAPAQRVSATVAAITAVAPVVLDWPIKDEADRSGNVIHYFYQHNPKTVVPYDEENLLDRIEYTDGPVGTSAHRSVVFEYGVRPDKSFAYHHGIRYQLRTRLTGIKILAPNPTVKSLVWEYKLAYVDQQYSVLGRSLLDSIQKCGFLGTCTFPKHMGWSYEGYPNHYEPVSRPFAGLQQPTDMLTFDANGDGRDDVLYRVLTTDSPPKTRFHLFLSQAGPGLAPYQDIVVGGSGLGTPLDDMNMGASRAADLDGDGRVDLLVMIKAPFVDTGDGSPVPLDPDATLNTFQPVHFTDVDQQFHIFGSPIKANSINLVDVNGDSLLDVVSYKKPDTYHVALSNGAAGWISQGTITSPATTCPVGRSGGDLDADGRGELIIPTANDCSTSVTVGLDDAGAVVATPSLPVQRGQREVQLADLNGDGLVDAFWLGDTMEISFNTGNGYGPPHPVSDPALDSVFALNPDWKKRSAIVMDVNRDGRDDLLFTVRDHTTFNFGDDVFHWNDAVVALLSNGDGSFTRDDLFDVDPGLGLRTADFDGDGRKDLFAVTPDGNLQIFLEHGDDDADLLSSVWDDDASSEPRLQIAYGRTNPADWASATCSFPTLCLRQGSPVVASVWGLDVGTRTYYRFEEPRLDLGGRGFLGYATVRVWNPARPMERTTTFDNVTRVGTVYPNAQRPKSMRTVVPIVNHGAEGIVDKVVSGNARISETTFDYELRAPQGGPSHFVFTEATHEHEWEESVAIDWNDTTRVHITGVAGPGVQGGAPREHNASFRVDDYNNLLSVSEGTVGGVIHSAVYTYDYRAALWLVGLQATRTEQTYDAGQSPDAIHVLNHYDLLGRLDVSTVEPGGDPDVTVVRSLDYDVRGRLIQETRTTAGQPTRARHFDYSDPSGEGVFLSQQWDDVDGAITLSKWMYAVPGFGGTMGIIDANGGVATTVHDDLGRPILVTGAGKKPATIAYSAWKHNPDIVHPAGVTAGLEVEVHDGGDAWQVVDTDARGLEVERRRAGFHGVAVVTNAGYDRFGRVLWQSRPDWGTASLARTERAYDSLDRVLSVAAPDGALSTQSYTFFERTATDPQQRVRKIVQDADRRVVTAIDMHDGQPLETTYLYVHGSQPEWVIDPQNNIIHSVFDVRGRRTLLEDPDAGTRATKYDGFGDVVETGDGAGNTTTYTLDRIGRATTIESDTDGTTTLTWDTQPHGLGQIAQTVSPDNTIVDSYYDAIGRPTKTDWTVPGPVVSMFSVEQSYDLDGRVSELRYPYALNRSRMVVTPYYEDGAGGVSRIEATDALGNPFDAWEATGRNADNSLTSAKLGTSMETARSYDALTGRLATIQTKGDNGSIVDLTFDYYSDGRLHVKNDHTAGRAESFEYDDLRRLTAWSLVSESVANYEYNALGNLTGVRDENGFQTEANSYSGDGPHQLSDRDGVTYKYDKRGRLYKSSEGLAIEYTDFDLPKSYTKGNVTTEFNYDAGHHRVRKAGPSGTTITLGGLYERREDANGTKHFFNIGGPDGMIAQVVYDQAHESEEVEYLHQDQLGSVAAATSPSGKEIDRLFYEPFGRRVDRHGSLLSGPASDVLTGFTGQRHDDDLGLIDMRGRTYDPILRRFLQPDPVIQDAYEGQSYNRYSYVTNDPVNLVDPTGFTAKKVSDGDVDPTGGTPESYDKDNAKLNSPEIVVTAGPEGPADHLGTDNNGEGAAVQGEAALADTSYQSSSTDQGLNTGGAGGSGGGPTTGPTGLCGGCQDTDAFSYFYRYGGYAQRGLLLGSGALVVAAGAVLALPGMVIGGLSTGGAGLIGGATVVTVPAVGAASAVAVAASTPTGGAIIEELEENAASGINLGEGVMSHFTNANGVAGITGVDPSTLQPGQSVSVSVLQFGEGANSFLAGSRGDVFVTELGETASSGQLNQIGVFGDKQDFAIQFSRESAFANGVSIDPVSAARSIYTIPGGSNLVSSPDGEGAFSFLVHMR